MRPASRLTRRGVARSVTLTTPALQAGAAPDDQWLAHADPTGTTAVYMAGRQLQASAAALLRRGHAPDTPTRVARAVSLPQQRIETHSLIELAAGCATCDDDTPCLLLVGEALHTPAETLDCLLLPKARRAEVA